jgi:hypothetical protein
MANMSTFHTVKSLNLEAVKKEISIQVIREPLISKYHQDIDSRSDIVLAVQKDGLLKWIDDVPRKRPFIKFIDVQDWINSEFSRIGLAFKLRRSVIETGKMSLYQEYIFNKEVCTPDGEGIAPMVLVKASHSRSGSPLELNLGTYRFTCANGAIVTVGTMSTIKITEANWKIYTNSELHNLFIQAFDQYDTVSELYAKLGKIKMIDVFDNLFSSNLLSLRLRKRILEKLENEKMIKITIDFNDPLMNKAMLKTKYLTGKMLEEPNTSISLTHKSMSLWNIYNFFTEEVTHGNKTSSGILCGSKAVNIVFRELAKVKR